MTQIKNFTDAVRVAMEQGGLDRHEWSNDAATLLKPVFWKALGKALGWESEYYNYECWPSVGKEFLEQGFYRGWEYHWHRYITYLSEGREAEFWKELR